MSIPYDPNFFLHNTRFIYLNDIIFSLKKQLKRPPEKFKEALRAGRISLSFTKKEGVLSLLRGETFLAPPEFMGMRRPEGFLFKKGG